MSEYKRHYIECWNFCGSCAIPERIKHCNTLQLTATHCNTPQITATHYSANDHPRLMVERATHCNKMQRTATQCNTMQHNTTHCSDYPLLVPERAKM